MSNPRVSVLMPAYNPGKYIDLAVQSVLDQTYDDWEMLIVDDGSTEDLSRFDCKHPAIRRIRQENRGLSIARNAAILNSAGEYIAWLDADDLWMPDKLRQQVAVMDANPELGFCHTNFDAVDGEGNHIGPGFGKAVASYAEILMECTVCISSGMIRRSCLSVSGLYDPFYFSVQDYDVWAKLMRFYPSAYIETIETRYRVHAQNMSSGFKKVYRDGNSLIYRHLTISREKKDAAGEAAALEALRRTKIAHGCRAFDYSRESLRQKNFSGALSHYFYAMRFAPAYVLRATFAYFAGGRGAKQESAK